ncbi:MAG: tRNA (adenosine(37)-N6)-dimethylallyltransferase MiaA [Oscillospiraceae bacterium]
MKNQVVVLCGPTASGKTALGVLLAKKLCGEVVSADSMQVYRRMNIGTAKPTPAEMDGVPHHMIDVADPSEDYSVGRYVADATRCVDGILSRGKLPILVGGTGLYLDALVSGTTFAPTDGSRRAALRQKVSQDGLPALYETLSAVDPQRAALLAPTDEKRILRALEVFYETGETITSHDARTRLLPPRYAAARLCLFFPEKTDLWQRIDSRVDAMMALGLLDEVRALQESGVPPNATALQAIGYKEFSAALRGEESVEAAQQVVKLRSRQYAKRQMTWFRRHPDTHFYGWEGTPNFRSALQNATTFLADYGIS